jgi:hypothetical protein
VQRRLAVRVRVVEREAEVVQEADLGSNVAST